MAQTAVQVKPWNGWPTWRNCSWFGGPLVILGAFPFLHFSVCEAWFLDVSLWGKKASALTKPYRQSKTLSLIWQSASAGEHCVAFMAGQPGLRCMPRGTMTSEPRRTHAVPCTPGHCTVWQNVEGHCAYTRAQCHQCTCTCMPQTQTRSAPSQSSLRSPSRCVGRVGAPLHVQHGTCPMLLPPTFDDVPRCDK